MYCYWFVIIPSFKETCVKLHLNNSINLRKLAAFVLKRRGE